jgi:peptide/nickel transport system permease protein
VRRFVATRLLHAVVVLFVVTTIAFFLLHLAPGDPFALDGPRMTPDLRDQLRAQFGYDRPLLEQYARYLVNVARGELGWSHSLQAPVSRVLAQAIPATLLLMSVSMVLGFVQLMRSTPFHSCSIPCRVSGWRSCSCWRSRTGCPGCRRAA